jgi:hypothetical protein
VDERDHAERDESCEVARAQRLALEHLGDLRVIFLRVSTSSYRPESAWQRALFVAKFVAALVGAPPSDIVECTFQLHYAFYAEQAMFHVEYARKVAETTKTFSVSTHYCGNEPTLALYDEELPCHMANYARDIINDDQRSQTTMEYVAKMTAKRARDPSTE